MTFIIKICGLSDDRSVDAAIDAGADMLGFVFFEPSPRHVSLAQAHALAGRVGSHARKVALSVDADDAMLAAIIEAVQPDLLQLHGQETPERVSAVRARFGVPVMRALTINDPSDLARVAAFDAVADHLLFDARAPAGSARPGGNGKVFDWTVLRGVKARRPWLLAGGLTVENVAYAIATTGAGGFDVSSSVESAPGRKDPERISRFVARARDEHARWTQARLERQDQSARGDDSRRGRSA